MENYWCDSEFDVQLWQVQVQTKQNPWGLNVKITSMNLSKGETGRGVYVLCILVRAILGVVAISLRRKIPEPCRRKLIT